MKILASIPRAPYTRYLVEREPETRIVFMTGGSGVYELSFPRTLYAILGPGNRSSPPRHGYNVDHGFALDQSFDPDVHPLFIPLPNYWWPECTFTNCASSVTLTEQDLALPTEDALEHILDRWFDAPFRYCVNLNHGPASEIATCFNWLGIQFPDRYYHIVQGEYSIWEEYSLEQICEFPWGKVKNPMTMKELLPWIS